VLEVKERLEKLLNDPKQYQSCRKMVMFKYSLESWNFFRICMRNSDVVVVRLQWRYTSKRLHCDLSLSSRSTVKDLTLLRIDPEISMPHARKLFGVTFGVGVRNRAPNKGEPPVLLTHADFVNLVNVNSGVNLNIEEADRRKELVTA
jgi:hypothetical protein